YCCRRRARVLTNSKITSTAGARLRNLSRHWKIRTRTPSKWPRAKKQMPRKLEADRTLFLSTLALCLIGAVMVFSASAVTAREQFGSAYYFLWRQIIWLAVGI